MSVSDSASQSSKSSFSDKSSVVSDNSDAGDLVNLTEKDEDANVKDLLDQDKGVLESCFLCMLLLTENRVVTSYRMLAFRVAFEYLQILRTVINTNFLWVIKEELWIWKAIKWIMFGRLIKNLGYDDYVTGVYIMCAVILVLTMCAVAIAAFLRKNNSRNKWFTRFMKTVQYLALLVFSICWVPVLEYLLYMFTCDWDHGGGHMAWESQQCTEMPHIASMLLAGGTSVVFSMGVVGLAMGECSGNYLTNNLTALTVPETAFYVTTMKVAMVAVATCLVDYRQAQAVLMFLCPMYSTYLQISSSPYLLPWMNYLWSGLWLGMVYITGLLMYLNFHGGKGVVEDIAFRQSMTWAILYGIFPSILVGMAVSYYIQKSKRRPLEHYEKARQAAARGEVQLESVAALKQIYRLKTPDQVEYLARCVRKFDPVTDLPLPEAVALSELIIKAGMARFPGNPTVLVQYACHILYVKKEPRAARTQLQVATKNDPGFIDRYNIYKSMDVSKKSLDGDAGLDLMAYVECQRNFRACLKAHKIALLAQRAFWRLLMRDALHMSDVLKAMRLMQETEETALYVYKRVLEKYPNNGKILRAWGKFQEWVLHDPIHAAKAYAEAVKQGMGDNLMAFSGDADAAPAGSSTAGPAAGKVDEKVDGVIIIDASGTILLVNSVAYRTFGYTKGELEGKNVSVMMPPPFNLRHDAYVRKYLTTGTPKILNRATQVVGLRKDHTMFASMLTVSKLSGTAQESVFMGVLKPIPEADPNLVRIWCSAMGTILCSDERFGDWFGVNTEDLVGRSVSTLTTQPELLDEFIRNRTGGSNDSKSAEGSQLIIPMVHKYLPAVNVDITLTLAGSATEQIVMLHIKCLIDAQKVMVVDGNGKLVYATSVLASMLGTKVPNLVKMHLPQLIPPPISQLHRLWMKDMGSRPWAGSCRSGAVVHMQSMSGTFIPVRLDIKSAVENSRDKSTHRHVVKVLKASNEEHLDGQRVSFVVDQQGVVLSVSGTCATQLFGFDGKDLIGRPLAAFVNVFEEYRATVNETELGTGIASLNKAANSTSKALGGADKGDAALLSILAQAAQAGLCSSYRVGVRTMPKTDEQIGKQTDKIAESKDTGTCAAAGGFTTLLTALSSRTSKLKPAVLSVEVMDQDLTAIDVNGLSAISKGLMFEIHLWRAEQLSGVLEIDPQFTVLKADAAVGHMLGIPAFKLQRKTLSSFLKLPSNVRSTSDLLADLPSKKASALKKTSSRIKLCSKNRSLTTVGPVLPAEGIHADGRDAALQLQAVAKEGQVNRLLVRVKVVAPASTGNLQALLRQAKVSSTGKALLGAGGMAGSASTRSLGPGLCATSDSSGEDGEEGVKESIADKEALQNEVAPAGRPRRASVRMNEIPIDLTEGNNREALALRRSSQAGARFAEGDGKEAPALARSSQAGARFAEGDGKDAAALARSSQAGVRSSQAGARGSQAGARGSQAGARFADVEFDWPKLDDEAKGQPRGHKAQAAARGYAEYPTGYDGHPTADAGYPQPQDDRRYQQIPSGYGGMVPMANLDDDGGGGLGFGTDSQPGMAERRASDGGSEAASEEDVSRMDVASMSEKGDEEDDITCDWRRAKRLKKIQQQLDSPVARAALIRFWKGTWCTIGVLLLVHIVCFALLAERLTTRARDVFGVQQMTYALDRSQMTMLRTTLIAGCGYSQFQDVPVCAPKQRDLWLDKLHVVADQLNYYHTGAFLGFDRKTIKRMTDRRLLDWWLLPTHTEVNFIDSQPPEEYIKNTTLWELGNKYINAAKEVHYVASSLDKTASALKEDIHWKFIDYNGIRSIIKGYTASLDMYVNSCWTQLGDLGDLLTGLLVVELVFIMLGLIIWQLDTTRRVAKQRMACFSVFLALPTATLRMMATASCQIDDEDDAADADEEQDAHNMGQATAKERSGEASVGDGTYKKEKSVRMAVSDGQEGGGGGGLKDKGEGRSPAKRSKRKRHQDEDQGWLHDQYKKIRHFMRGILNRTIKVNGKSLQPGRGVFMRFMGPLLLWWIFALAIFGASYERLHKLKAPLSSLQAASHVQYGFSRTRLLASRLALSTNSTTAAERAELKTIMWKDLNNLQKEYFTLLYGGSVTSALSTDPPIEAPSSIYADRLIADIFFKTTGCLRSDKSTCLTDSSQWYQIVHSGLDAMVQQYFAYMHEFLALPDELQSANASSYNYNFVVGANDLYDGLQAASDIFAGTSLTALQNLQELHTALLICTILLLVVFVVALLYPFKSQLLGESMRVAGLLSQLPQAADIEGQVKALVIDVAANRKPNAETNTAWNMARSITAAAAAAARAATAKATGATKGGYSHEDQAAAAGGGYQRQYDGEQSENSSAAEWE